MSYEEPAFDGVTYDHDRDYERLMSQLNQVFEIMKDGKWYTIQDVTARVTHGTETSISEKIRSLRKDKHGAHTVERRYLSNGLYEYKLTVNPNTTRMSE
jgi:hypothetical protein